MMTTTMCTPATNSSPVLRAPDQSEFNSRHGGPWDRGTADSWYSRPRKPHYYTGDTGVGQAILAAEMTPAEIMAYNAGYDWNEDFGDKKSYD